MRRKNRTRKEHLHTTINPAVLEVLSRNAPPRGWGSWLEEAILDYAGRSGDVSALDSRIDALKSKRDSIKDEIARLTGDLERIRLDIEELESVRARISTTTVEDYLAPLLHRIEESAPGYIREWLGDPKSPAILEDVEVERDGLIFESFRYVVSKNGRRALVEYLERKYQTMTERIRREAKMKAVLITETDIRHLFETYIDERLDEILEERNRELEEREYKNALRRMERALKMEVER